MLMHEKPCLIPIMNHVIKRFLLQIIFFQGIGIVPEEQWDAFLETMKKPLPATFRITGSRKYVIQSG